MPLDIGGAYVSCYVASDNYINATKLALKNLIVMGFILKKYFNPLMK